MKIQKFLENIQIELLNRPNIDLNTLRLIFYEFQDCLSDKEQKRWNNDLNLILELSTKQISLDILANKLKNKSLESELNNIKGGIPK